MSVVSSKQITTEQPIIGRIIKDLRRFIFKFYAHIEQIRMKLEYDGKTQRTWAYLKCINVLPFAIWNWNFAAVEVTPRESKFASNFILGELCLICVKIKKFLMFIKKSSGSVSVLFKIRSRKIILAFPETFIFYAKCSFPQNKSIN